MAQIVAGAEVVGILGELGKKIGEPLAENTNEVTIRVINQRDDVMQV